MALRSLIVLSQHYQAQRTQCEFPRLVFGGGSALGKNLDTLADVSTELRATAFHEAGHAVAAIALEHVIEWIRIEPPGGRYPGLTKRTVAGPGTLLNEECAVIEAIGGLAEAKHDKNWTPTPRSRDDDLKDVRDRLRNTGSRPENIDAFMRRADEIASELLECECLWAGVTALAAHLEECALKHPGQPTRFPGANVTRIVRLAVSQECLDVCAARVRGYGTELHALR